MIFPDRQQAGQLLAQALAKFAGQNVLVYALPRGGVVLGVEVAKALEAPLSLVITRKIGHPQDPEFALGAITETGQLIGGEELRVVDPDWLADEIDRQRAEAKRRRQKYLAGRKTFDPKDRICILVDDGLATGLTMRAAVSQLRGQGASQIVVAVPVGPKDTVALLKPEAQEVVCLHTPETFMGSIGYYYQKFQPVEDETVVQLLQQAT